MSAKVVLVTAITAVLLVGRGLVVRVRGQTYLPLLEPVVRTLKSAKILETVYSD